MNILMKNLKDYSRDGNQFERSSNLNHLIMLIRTDSSYVIASKT
jgi:hypothetical protein